MTEDITFDPNEIKVKTKVPEVNNLTFTFSNNKYYRHQFVIIFVAEKQTQECSAWRNFVFILRVEV